MFVSDECFVKLAKKTNLESNFLPSSKSVPVYICPHPCSVLSVRATNSCSSTHVVNRNRVAFLGLFGAISWGKGRLNPKFSWCLLCYHDNGEQETREPVKELHGGSLTSELGTVPTCQSLLGRLRESAYIQQQLQHVLRRGQSSLREIISQINRPQTNARSPPRFTKFHEPTGRNIVFYILT